MAIVKITKEEFEEKVLKADKPALVEFSAPWCTYCRRIGPVMKKVAEQYEETLLTGEINIDDEEALAEEYQVEIIPTLMIFKDGERKGTVVNPGSKADIDKFIKEHLG
ncbi:MAG: thioredoxin family protein [Eubacteriales bacterium]|nr:thioredoxin family protein [Eubacteriales bacterium]